MKPKTRPQVSNRPLPSSDDNASLRELHWVGLGSSVVLFGVATMLACYLAWGALTNGIAGCGIDSPCSRVLQSRWAYWFGLPVSLPAALVYLVLLVTACRRIATMRAARLPRDWFCAGLLSVVVLTAAFWFVVLQIFVIGSFCVFCLITHLAAVTGASLLFTDFVRRKDPRTRAKEALKLAVGGIAVSGLLVFGQMVIDKETNRVSPISAPVTDTPVESTGRRIDLYDGRFHLDLKDVPCIGSPSAPHLIVSVFDYTCSHCRATHELLVKVIPEYGDELAIVTVPMPLDSNCNALVRQTSRENLNACEYARIGLAVWHVKPPAYREFSAWVLASPTLPAPEIVRKYAERLVGKGELAAALAGVRIDAQLRLGISLFEANSKRGGSWQLPQLIVGKSLSIGSLRSVDSLRSMVFEEFGLSPVSGRADTTVAKP
jgi:uncharacterized membrane protein